MSVEFEFQGDVATVLPVYARDRIDLSVDGTVVSASLEDLGGGAFVVEVDGLVLPLRIATWGDAVFLHADGETYRVDAVNSLERAAEEARGDQAADVLVAPMPGVVVSIARRPGEHVARGEVVLTIESMKLQTALLAPRDGRVEEIRFEEGAGFDKGAVLAILAKEDEA